MISSVYGKSLIRYPTTWTFVPLKRVCTLNGDTLPEDTDADYEFRYIDIGNVSSLGRWSPSEPISFSTAPSRARRMVRSGDVIISTVRTYLKAVAFLKSVTDPTVCSTGFAVISHGKKVDPSFLAYWIQSSPIIDEVVSRSVGVSYPAVNASEIGGLPFPHIDVRFQRAIASFLDRKTAQIDALIAAYERLMALLEEKRQAVITQAVTKGLDPTVPMKDSGVEWLGEVPEHWGISKLGRLVIEFQTGPFGSQLHASDYIEDGTPVINPANLTSGAIKPDPQNTVDDNIVVRLSRHKLREGDIVFGRRGEMGRCALVTRRSVGFLCGTGCIIVRVNAHAMMPSFSEIYIRTQGVREFLQLQSVGSTMDNLNTDILSSIPFAVPPYIEQQQIIEHVSHQITQYDEVSQSVRRATVLLAEYRSALITAAVTGQIDVTEEVTQDA